MNENILIKKCPYCSSSLYADETACRFCGRNVNLRKCPYCKNIIPAEEDPCHFCGHLEPADAKTINAYYKREALNNFCLGGLVDGVARLFFEFVGNMFSNS